MGDFFFLVTAKATSCPSAILTLMLTLTVGVILLFLFCDIGFDGKEGKARGSGGPKTLPHYLSHIFLKRIA